MAEFATPEGTKRYADRLAAKGMPATAFRPLGGTGLATSVLGFGCYRIDDDVPEHHAALEKALADGCNLIDTSTNYSDGGSEICVGNSLKVAIAAGTVKRDEVIVVSKLGYAQGENLTLLQEREKSGKPFPEVVKYMDGCWHCMHPEFVRDQLARSLERLQLNRLDVYLIHNPEYFFAEARKHQRNAPIDEVRDAFYGRIKAAFACLEGEVKAGRLSWYGVSSNSFGGPTDDLETTSLSRMWDIAGEVGGGADKHHFRVAQLPANLFESGPVLVANNGKGGAQTALGFAREKKIAVLVNRPLNAFVRSQLVRLADPEIVPGAPEPAAQIKTIAALEDEFASAIAPHIEIQGANVAPAELFRWAGELANPELLTLPSEHWADIESQMVRPRVHYLTEQLNAHFGGSDHESAWKAWRDRYRPALEQLLDGIRNETGKRSRKVSQALAAKLDPFLPAEQKSHSLSRKALATLIHTPGVTCVLNGMRRLRYVDDSMGASRFAPFTTPDGAYTAFRI